MIGATGVGSMPGTSVPEAVAVVAGELPDLPHLVELPARGAGADMVGRTAALLTAVDPAFGLETVPTGWQRSGGWTPEMRRARSWLGEDLDRTEQVFADSRGDFKVQVCGPWTWAAGVEDAAGRRLVGDEGFVSDLAAGFSVAVATHLADVGRRLPGRRLVLQIDEPTLPALLDGRIPTRSGWGRLPAVSPSEVAVALGRVVASADVDTILHCCDTYPFDVVRAAGFTAMSWDLGVIPSGEPLGADPATADRVAEAWEAGLGLVAGVVPTRTEVGPGELWAQVRQWWHRTGLPTDGLADVVFSPACGLAGLEPGRARAALAAALEVHRRAAGHDRR